MDFSFTPYWMTTLLQIQIGSKLQHHQPSYDKKGAMLELLRVFDDCWKAWVLGFKRLIIM
jgi:hypothetical protein